MRRFETRDMRPETRARKRQRLSSAAALAPCAALPNTNAPASARLKRSHSALFSPSSHSSQLRKRRRSNATALTPPSTKRQRTVDPSDVQMSDVCDRVQRPGRKRRKRLLRDVLRAEKISRSALAGLQVRSQGEMRSIDEGGVAQRVGAAAADMVGLTGDEEVCEVVDASENSDPNVGHGYGCLNGTDAGVTPSVQAVLLEDGLCAVHIVRVDGSVQSVLIQPPGRQ